MSHSWRVYCEETGVDPQDRVALKAWLRKEMKRNEDGTPAFLTQQSDKDAADINKIIRKFDAKGIMELQNQMTIDETKLIDVPSGSYHESMNIVSRVNSEFEELPSDVRNYFRNDPGAYLAYLQRPTPAKDDVKEVIPQEEKKPPKKAPEEPKKTDTTE